MYCLVVFLIFKGLFASLRKSFFDFGKNFTPPPGIRPSFLVLGQKKIARVAGIRSLNTIFPGGGGGMFPVGTD